MLWSWPAFATTGMYGPIGLTAGAISGAVAATLIVRRLLSVLVGDVLTGDAGQ